MINSDGIQASGTHTHFAQQLRESYDAAGRWEKATKKVAGSLYSAESRLIQLAGKDRNEAEEREYAALQVKYQRLQRGWEMFQQILKNIHEMAMTVIRNLRS